MDQVDVNAGGYLFLWPNAEVGEGDFPKKDTGVKNLTFLSILRCGTNHIGSEQAKNDTLRNIPQTSCSIAVLHGWMLHNGFHFDSAGHKLPFLGKY